jgi:predicted pyridoxine 5'-phosphate oxidase superfamily flavin-nucleotide-binding protein
MARAFASITFTPSVRATQLRYGSRRANEGFEQAEDPRDELTSREAEFIEARDSFYQASVSETGWPYVQFRGGPKGFLKVLDEKTIGYADFRGNVQYISAGNIDADGRVALILMDYPNRRRLKIWGRARLVHADEDADLLVRLEIPTYRARVERAVIVTVEAFDWNCPQHITRRFTEEEIAELTAPLAREIERLAAVNDDLERLAEAPALQERVDPRHDGIDEAQAETDADGSNGKAAEHDHPVSLHQSDPDETDCDAEGNLSDQRGREDERQGKHQQDQAHQPHPESIVQQGHAGPREAFQPAKDRQGPSERAIDVTAGQGSA